MKLQPKKSKTNTHVELPAKVKLAPLKKAEAPKSTPTCAPPVESCNSSDILYQVKSYLNSLGGAEVLHTLNSITGGGVFNPELTIQLVTSLLLLEIVNYSLTLEYIHYNLIHYK